jgi:hypothetical protein
LVYIPHVTPIDFEKIWLLTITSNPDFLGFPLNLTLWPSMLIVAYAPEGKKRRVIFMRFLRLLLRTDENQVGGPCFDYL